ncbi:MAG: hypothetical protein LBP34_01100 [Flavobacteriaceae bacterium]|jgi:hypothetical protein|nr:hypothetical protein [Flavobacteriaceae bacterium]
MKRWNRQKNIIDSALWVLSNKILQIFIVIVFLQNCQTKQYDEVKVSEEIIDNLKYDRKEYLKNGISVKIVTEILGGKKISESWLVKSKKDKYLYYNLQYNQKGDTVIKKYFQTNKGEAFYVYGWGYYNYEDGNYEYKQYYPIKDSSVINQFKFYKNGKLIKDSSSYYRIIDRGEKKEIILQALADDAILLLSDKLHNNYDNLHQIRYFDTLFPIRPFVWEIPNNKELKGVIKIIKFKGKPYYSEKEKSFLQKISEKDMYLGQVNTMESVDKVDKKLLWQE